MPIPFHSLSHLLLAKQISVSIRQLPIVLSGEQISFAFCQRAGRRYAVRAHLTPPDLFCARRMAARPRSRHGTPSLYPPHLTSLPAITFAPSLRVMAQVRVSAGTRPTQDAVTDTIPPFDQHHRLYSSPRTVISPGLHHLTLASLFSPDSGIVLNVAESIAPLARSLPPTPARCSTSPVGCQGPRQPVHKSGFAALVEPSGQTAYPSSSRSIPARISYTNVGHPCYNNQHLQGSFRSVCAPPLRAPLPLLRAASISSPTLLSRACIHSTSAQRFSDAEGQEDRGQQRRKSNWANRRRQDNRGGDRRQQNNQGGGERQRREPAPLIGRYTDSFPVELFRVNGGDRIFLRDYHKQRSLGRNGFDITLGEDQLVHPRPGADYSGRNGLSMRPLNPVLTENVERFNSPSARIFRLPEGTSLEGSGLVLLHEHTDHYSLQTTESVTLEELNQRLTDFCTKVGELLTKEEWLERYASQQ
ncbi:hypothetical protein CF336_g5829 [Tilletia laevis]|nr:hypothetical protein CF336_g5829 [Tilletia laevis]